MVTYHGGDIDTISLVNGKLDLHAPLISWPQRGKLNFGFTIRYDNPRYSETEDDPGDLLPAFRTKLSMISAKVNRSHSLSQARLEVRGSVSPFLRC